MMHSRDATRLHNKPLLTHNPGAVSQIRVPTFLLRRKPKNVSQIRHSLSQPSQNSIVNLKERIRVAIDEEDYEAAAQLRDELKEKEEDAHSAVEEANRMFYVAFQQGDSKILQSILGEGSHVQCMHPMTPCLAGHNDVQAGWHLIFQGIRNVQDLKISLRDVRIHVGEDQAFVTCVECMEGVNSTGWTAATNIFEKQNGRWKLIHHQGGPLPVAQENPTI